MRSVMPTVNSYAQLPCCVQKTLFPSSLSNPLITTLFTLLLPQWFLNLWRGVGYTLSYSRIFYSLFLSLLWPVVDFCVDIIYCKQNLLWLHLKPILHYEPVFSVIIVLRTYTCTDHRPYERMHYYCITKNGYNNKPVPDNSPSYAYVKTHTENFWRTIKNVQDLYPYF